MSSVIRTLWLGVLAAIFLTPYSIAQVTDGNTYSPPNYSTFQPPAAGNSYTDPVFGTSIQRVTVAPTTQNLDAGGNLIFITDEYSSMTPFNLDNSKILLIHQSYFALYDGSGTFLKALPMEISAASEPRWSRTDPNTLYYHVGNQLKKYDLSADSRSVVRTFSEYSTISGKGESDLSFDGDYMVFAGDNRFVFVYRLSTDSKGPAFDTGGRGFDSLYITPDNNVTITWLQAGTNRYSGIELFDQNMNFLRQLAHAGGHMDVTRDGSSEVLVWTNSGDPQPLAGCDNGIVKIRLSDAAQTCLLSLDWSLAIHVSGADNSGYVFVETYAPSNPTPGASNWVRYTNEILQIKLDGSEVRRLAHHRSRPFDSYNWMPRVSVSRDGGRLIYNSNYNLQSTLGYASDYADVYLATVPSSTGGNTGGGTTGGGSTGGGGATGGGNTGGGTSGGASTTRTEQTAAAVSYTGTWHANGLAGHSGGGAALSIDAGSRAKFTFTGTGVRWLGYRDEWSGVANVYLDGQFKGTVDAYASPSQYQAMLYSASGLTANTHTLEIEVTGTHGPASQGAWVWVDAFDVDVASSSSGGTGGGTTPPPPPPPPAVTASRVEQNHSSAAYAGTWFSRNGASFSGGSAALAMDKGSSVTFTFTGTGASWVGYKDAWSGVACIFVDGVRVGKFDTYSPTDTAQPVIYSISGLSQGTHTLKIEVQQRKSAASGGVWVWVDAFEAKP